jgi:cysteine synthase A
MGRVYEDNSQSIGNSPLVRLNRIPKGLDCTVLAKIEGRNPAYSVKCRIGASMVWAAERDGILERLRGPLAEVRRHRMGRVTEQRHAVASPLGKRQTVVDRQSRQCCRRRCRHDGGNRIVPTAQPLG